MSAMDEAGLASVGVDSWSGSTPAVFFCTSSDVDDLLIFLWIINDCSQAPIHYPLSPLINCCAVGGLLGGGGQPVGRHIENYRAFCIIQFL